MIITEGFRRALELACKQLVRECVKTCPIAQGRGAQARLRKYCWHAKEPCYKICMRYLMAKARRPNEKA
jgi:hypothetical protein